MSTATVNASPAGIPAPRRAEKKRVKLKMAVQGPSGSGKTWGALALAKNLWPEGRICLIDTENESASLYADSFEFDTIPLAPPFGTDRYLACINAAVKAGYDVLIVDSITPQWDGEGGILRRKEEMDRRPGSNGYANWASFTPEHELFKQALQQSPIHMICTMRSKQDYILTANDKGKQIPKKVGMAPIQRDQMDYEFTLVFDVEMDHKGSASKDRTGLFNEKIVDLASPKTAEIIRDWLAKGKEAAPAVESPAEPVLVAAAPSAALDSERASWLDAITPLSPEEFVRDVVPMMHDDMRRRFVACADDNLMAVVFNRLPDAASFSAFFVPMNSVAVEMGRKYFVIKMVRPEAQRRGYTVDRVNGTYVQKEAQ